MVEVTGAGNANRRLAEDEVRALLAGLADSWDLAGRRVLFVIPDGTRTAPMPLMFRLLHEQLAGVVARMDFVVALGTHPLLDDAAIDALLGIDPSDRAGRYAGVGIFNHRWDLPDTFVTIGAIPAAEAGELSEGRLAVEVPVRINRAVLEYDLLVVCGPVFPHEIVGFSGGNKYFFPGVGGPEVIDFTHWLGALETSYQLIGVGGTPVREAIERAASFIPTPTAAMCMVVADDGLAGLYLGPVRAAWEQAAKLSAQVHVRYVPHPFRQVLAVVPPMYGDLWTGAKAMYKVEPVVADGGEVILYAPHITEFSATHGEVIEHIGYHVRDYYLAQWDRFAGFPWAVLAHSTHVKGIGTYRDGVETPRIRVSLASAIPPERCEAVNLAYRDLATIDPAAYAGREDDGILMLPKAGETLYRLESNRP